MPVDVKVAVPWFKPAHNQTRRTPDLYTHTTDKWLVLPYEMVGLSESEIYANKPGLEAIMKTVKC